MSIATVNPATGETLKTFEGLSDAELEDKLERAARVFVEFRKSTFADRAGRMVKAAEILEADKEKFGRVMDNRITHCGTTFRRREVRAIRA